jgi:alpha-galactosidase
MIHHSRERVRMGLFDTPHLGPGPSAEARIAGLRVLIEATGCTDLRVEAVPAEPAEPGEGELRVTALGHLDGVQARVRASWSLPCLDAEAYWTPQSREQPWIPPDWLPPRTTSLTRDAPVGCLLGPDDRNILCYALAETTRPVQIRAGVSEETGEFRFRVEHDLRGDEPLRLLLDTAPRHFADSLARVAAWWSRQDRHRSPAVPDAARRPVYSTWYSHHQRVSAAEVARCTRLAAELGCGVPGTAARTRAGRRCRRRGPRRCGRSGRGRSAGPSPSPRWWRSRGRCRRSASRRPR